MPRFGCCLMVIVVALSGMACQEMAVADDSLFVPKDEVIQLLDSYALELGTKSARPGSGTEDEPYGTLPADRRARLVALAAADGIPENVVPRILALIPNRVEAAIRDLYAVNLEPVRLGKVNVEDLGMPVLRTEFDRFKVAKVDLDAYVTQTLQPLREAEWASIETRFQFQLKRMKAFEQKVKEIDEKYPAFGGGDGTARAKAIEAALDTLRNVLAKQWNALDAAETKLAQGYVRKMFLFPLPPPYSGSNAARLIVDGHDYYGRLDELLGEVVNKAAGQGRVHIALWWCKANTLISPTETFLDAIGRVAAAGNEVQVLLWEGSSTAFPGVQADNKDCAARINALGGKAEAKLISGPWTGSHHDKYFVVSDGADYRALVGGMNIDGGQWNSSLGPTMAPHPNSNGGWFDVHDVGVELEGPSVIDVDLDFRQRWSDAGGTRTIYEEKASYPAGEDVNEVAISVTTSHETWTGKLFGPSAKRTGVRDELLQRIAGADRYVYLENYAILDEQLIKALGHKIVQQRRLGRPFDVILVTHRDWGPVSPTLYGWLHYITYLSLSFMNTDSFTYLDEQGLSHSVDRQQDGATLWEVGPYQGKWNEETEVMWSSGGGATSHTRLTSILGFGHDLPLYYLAYRDNNGQEVPIWVHSKFGLFDDVYGVVGSANFNFRSLTTDNELSAFVHGPSAAGFREMLWSEYWGKTVPAPNEWPAAVAALNNTALRNGEVVVRPLTLNDFPRDIDKITSRMSWMRRRTDASWY